jgi:hypothetical protein
VVVPPAVLLARGLLLHLEAFQRCTLTTTVHMEPWEALPIVITRSTCLHSRPNFLLWR